MVWLPDGEKNFEDIFIGFDMIHERDRHTDAQTLHNGIGRACIASRGNNRSANLTNVADLSQYYVLRKNYNGVAIPELN